MGTQLFSGDLGMLIGQKLLAYGLLPLGIGLTLCLLTPFKLLERIAITFWKRATFKVGTNKVRVPVLALGVSAIMLSWEQMKLQTLQNEKGNLVHPYNNSFKANVVRHQGNWWMDLCSLIVWLVFTRLSVIIRSHMEQLERLEAVIDLDKSASVK